MAAFRHKVSVMFLVATLLLSTACSRGAPPDPGAAASTGGPASSRTVGGGLPRGPGDYRITPSDPKQCDWVSDERGTIHIGGYFVGAYSGPTPQPTAIPYGVRDNIDANSDSGYARLGPVHYSLPVATRKVPYTYVLMVSLHPPGIDQDPGNDTASLAIEVPVDTPLTIPEPLPCS